MRKVIDVRVSPRVKECLGSWTPPNTIPPYRKYLERYPGARERMYPIPMEEMFAEMDRSGVVKAVIGGADIETTWGRRIPDEVIADLVQKYPDRFIGFAGADPFKGMEAVRGVERAVHELGLRGLCLDPWLHGLKANDKRYYPLYTKAAELRIPINIHTSQHFHSDMPMETGNPSNLDEVACHFPELKLIARHAGWPWVLPMVAVAWRHENVYIELSGLAPRYLHTDYLRYFDTVLQDRVLYGTSYPVLTWERTIKELEELPLKEETKEKILYRNAARLLGIED